MSTALYLGNGKLLVGLQSSGQIKDFYFPYPGLENHVAKDMEHKIGVFADGKFSWFGDSWDIKVSLEEKTMAGQVFAKNSELNVEIVFEDVVYNEKNIFLRKVEVNNLADYDREIKIYFNQQFSISQTITGDTAYFDPRDNTLIHYKGRRVFLVNVLKEIEAKVEDYCVGLIGIEGKDGTYKDAEDGVLEKNAIEHGRVDSVLGVNLRIEGKKKKTFYYWICCAKTLKVAKKLNNYVIRRHPMELIISTKNYWTAWVSNQKFTFYSLSQEIIKLFEKSIVTIRSHVADNGAILASGDSSMLQYGRDTYSYVWPRDAAIVALSLIKIGDFNAAKRFFEFANDIVSTEGYFMHKYRPDKALGSSWHPWERNDHKQLPIQEDETALVIISLWKYFELSKDLEFLESVYNSLIKKTAEFMVNYINLNTGLPEPSYDLWEEKYATHTYTSAATYQALMVSAKISELLGKEKNAAHFKEKAQNIKKGILKYLYNQDTKLFYKSINIDEGKISVDETVDFSSIYGVFRFEVLESNDPLLKESFDKFLERVSIKNEVGGIARFENDVYHRSSHQFPGNPWIITTMWLSQYKISNISSEQDLPSITKYFTWAAHNAISSGMLPEQLEAGGGEPRSAVPLIWSHAEFVISVIEYLEKLESLGICKACYPLK